MPEKVQFSNSPAVFEAAARLFIEVADRIRAILPNADIEHVGSTAIPGCLTKGDLDIYVRVDREGFEQADRALAALYARNEGSDRNELFSAFRDASTSPDLGVQLAVKGSKYDIFIDWMNALRSDEELLAAYDALKADFHGKAMSEYRAAKDEFISANLRVDE